MNIRIPAAVQGQLFELRRPPAVYDAAKGGQYKKQPLERIAFVGAVLPMSADDLRRAPQGTYTVNTRKLYTEHALVPGVEVERDGSVYTVTGALDYGTINPMKRYTMERKGDSK